MPLDDCPFEADEPATGFEVWIVPSVFPLFSLGQTVATPAALEALEQAGQDAYEFLSRHTRGDWGELGAEDKQSNHDALHDEGRLLSAYSLSDGTRLWVITEGDRSVTTVLLPSDY